MSALLAAASTLLATGWAGVDWGLGVQTALTTDWARAAGGGIGVLLLLLLLDRLLLRAEARGWINYRRNGLSRPGALYHMLELQSMLDPAVKPVIEIQYQSRREEDFNGDGVGQWDDDEEHGVEERGVEERGAGAEGGM